MDDILEALANGWHVEEVSQNYKIPLEAVYETLRYASETIRKVEIIVTES